MNTRFTRNPPAEKRSAARRRLAALPLVALLLAGCAAGRGAYNLGLQAELVRDYETALAYYERALAEKPGDIEYRLKVEQARYAAAVQRFEDGRRALDAGDLERARGEFARARQLDPSYEMARTELVRVERLIAADTAEETIPALDFEVRRELARTDPSLDLRLDTPLQEPISLTINQEAGAVFETVTELAGLNVIFDPDWSVNQRQTELSIDLDDVSLYQALDIIALQTRTFWEPVNRTTIIVAPDNTQKRQAYENTVLKTIYMTNSVNPTDLTEAITALRQLLNMRLIAQSTSMNAIIVRDTPGRIAIAEKIIDDFDKSRPEVLVEATVLEVDRNRLRELGILPPQGTRIGLDRTGSGDGAPPTPLDTVAGGVNLRDLDNLNSGSFNITIPDSVARFLASDSRTRLVQNPSVRATDGNQASIRIGSRVPVASGSFQPAFVGATGTPVVQFQYIDVGVNMDITPRVMLNREIAMQVVVQVQATAGNNVISGVALPVLSNRSVTHEIRLNEGETNILGGLITDTESTTMSGIPGLSRIPLLNRLFSSETTQREQTEIIVLLTPHIVRMPEISDMNLRGLEVGPESDTRLRSLPGGPPSLPLPVTAPEAGPEPEDADGPDGPSEDADSPDGLSEDADGPDGPSEDADGPDGPFADAVRFDGPELTIEPGASTDVIVHVDAGPLTGADLTIEFDPAVLALREVADGGFLSQGGAGIALARNIDTARGRAVVSLERTPPSPAVRGAGEIVRLTLEGVGAGESVVRIREFRVHDGATGERRGSPAEVRVRVQ